MPLRKDTPGSSQKAKLSSDHYFVLIILFIVLQYFNASIYCNCYFPINGGLNITDKLTKCILKLRYILFNGIYAKAKDKSNV